MALYFAWFFCFIYFDSYSFSLAGFSTVNFIVFCLFNCKRNNILLGVIEHAWFIDSVVFLLLAFLIFTPRWGLQYSSWVLPFAAAAQFKNEINIYSLVASCYLALSYSLLIIKDNLQIIEPLTNIAMLIGLITWCFLILWFVHIIKTRTN